jgi:hypothetical protein
MKKGWILRRFWKDIANNRGKRQRWENEKEEIKSKRGKQF